MVGFAGSLRRTSYNRALLRAAVELVPDGMIIDVIDLAGVPFYNGDIESDGLPDEVAFLRDQIAVADGLLIVSPEYNGGPSAITKNAIDWGSRAPSAPLAGKPVALAGVGGRFGTVRAQSHLRDNLLHTHSIVLNRTLALTRDGLFDAKMNLADEAARDRVRRHLSHFADWMVRFR